MYKGLPARFAESDPWHISLLDDGLVGVAGDGAVTLWPWGSIAEVDS